MNVLDLEEGKYYVLDQPTSKAFFKRFRGELLVSSDAVNWRKTSEVMKFDDLRLLTGFREVSLAVTYTPIPTAEEVAKAKELAAKTEELKKALPEITQDDADRLAKALEAGATPTAPADLAAAASPAN